jgi:chromosome segregation ATPase
MQFSEAVNKQLVMIPDEITRFRAALATATAMGVTPQSLVDDTSYYMGILKTEAGKFEATMASVVKNNITSKETQIKNIDDETQKKAEEIKRLTDEINELQSQKGAISNEISQQKAKVEQAHNNFGATLKVFIDKINTDLEKIKKYLLTPTGGSNV